MMKVIKKSDVVSEWISAVKASGTTRGMVRLSWISKATELQARMDKLQLKEAALEIKKFNMIEIKSLMGCGPKREIRSAIFQEMENRGIEK